jgi:hypothetical protein
MWPDSAQCSTACKHQWALLTYWNHSPCQAGQSGVQTPVGERSSIPTQTGPEAHPCSCTMDLGGRGARQSGQGDDHSPHLVPWLKKGWSYTSMLHLCLHGILQGGLHIFTEHCTTSDAMFSCCLNPHWTAQPSPHMLPTFLHVLYERHDHYFSRKRWNYELNCILWNQQDIGHYILNCVKYSCCLNIYNNSVCTSPHLCLKYTMFVGLRWWMALTSASGTAYDDILPVHLPDILIRGCRCNGENYLCHTYFYHWGSL